MLEKRKERGVAMVYCRFSGTPTDRDGEWLEFAALGEGILKAKSRRKKGVEKREKPKAGVEKAPKASVENKVLNAGEEEAVPNGDEKGSKQKVQSSVIRGDWTDEFLKIGGTPPSEVRNVSRFPSCIKLRWRRVFVAGGRVVVIGGRVVVTDQE
ncbi:unnamed protein product [Sphenostylis stenocarpa]|uniref:Uncharacterized protein n=1 Tax=Sphenostylis stenocarpa TaxID=92480 RepID=A0AA86SZ77_9FABA|nr:unnamed protein product [Sphenostylis stenocarpa]